MTKMVRDALTRALKARLEGRKVRAPQFGEHLLGAFLDLSRARSYGPQGPNPITWEALAAWSRVMRQPLRPQDAEVIMALDDVWMTHAMKQAQPSAIPNLSAAPLTADVMDMILR